jgi:hypothetical protein
VQEADRPGQQLVDLRGALEGQDRQRQVEALAGDRLRAGELLEPVLSRRAMSTPPFFEKTAPARP